MAKKPDQATIDAIQNDAAAGMNTNAIAEKHSVGWSTAKKYSGSGGGKPIAKLRTKSNRETHAAGTCSMTLTSQLADAIWSTLPIAKKAALLQLLE